MKIERFTRDAAGAGTQGCWPAAGACGGRGNYGVCAHAQTARMPVVISRRDCADYTTLAERVADKEGERARVAALNREMRRQIRREHPLAYWLKWASIIIIYLAVGLAALMWGKK